MDKLKKILNNININKKKSSEEIKEHTLIFLEKYKNDNLLDLIEQASQRGYSGIEWINFFGLGGMDSNIIIEWSYNVIIEQKLEKIIEPYYNNINHRLGISIKRCYINYKPMFLPMELRKNIKIVSIKKSNRVSNIIEKKNFLFDNIKKNNIVHVNNRNLYTIIEENEECKKDNVKSIKNNNFEINLNVSHFNENKK
jgi:hypothetical protein